MQVIHNMMIRIRHRLPQFLVVLVFVEMWERFSFYSLRNLLTLYLTDRNAMNLDDASAYAIYSLLQSFGFLLTILTGYLADTLFGFCLMLQVGGVIIMCGHFSMFLGMFSNNFTYLGIAFISTGTGLFKGNISSLLGCAYDKHPESNRINGFTLFYAGINFGSLVSSFAAGYMSYYLGYNYAFGLAGLGMGFGLLLFNYYRHIYDDLDKTPKYNFTKRRIFWKIGYGLALFILWFIFCFPFSFVYKYSIVLTKFNFLLYLAIVLVIAMAYLIFSIKNIRERKNLCILLIYLIHLMFFFAFELQLGSLFMLFIERNVYQYLWTIPVPAVVSSSINPALIIVVGLISGLFSKNDSKYDSLKITIALLSNSVCFFILYWGCLNADDFGYTSYLYPILAILIMAIGEIMISPLIQAHATIYSPKAIKGFIMGITMSVLGFASLAGLLFANIFYIEKNQEGTIDPLVSLPIYQKGFWELALYNLIFVASYIICIPILKYLHHVTSHERSLANSPKIVTIQEPTDDNVLIGQFENQRSHHDSL